VVEGENNKRSWNEVIGVRKRGKWNECPSGMVWENVLEGEKLLVGRETLFAFGSCESFVKFCKSSQSYVKTSRYASHLLIHAPGEPSPEASNLSLHIFLSVFNLLVS
jgi:hypothetical protein